jgi:hypothetical protein
MNTAIEVLMTAKNMPSLIDSKIGRFSKELYRIDEKYGVKKF